MTETAAEAIIETAKNNRCDLIVMSSHGRRSLARVLFGSQAARVLTLSSVPAMDCRYRLHRGAPRTLLPWWGETRLLPPACFPLQS